MGDFRVKYGWALGPEGTYAAGSGSTLIPFGDTTPDVTTGVLFYTNNTSATTITYFDVQGAGGINGDSAHEGKMIYLFFRDGNTSLTASSIMQLAGGTGVVPAGTVSHFLYHNSAWYEINRESPSASGATQTVTIGGTQNALDVTAQEVIIILATGATTIKGISGGFTGQEITLFKAAISVGTSVILQGDANFWLADTNAFAMSASAGYQFVCDVAPRFRQIGGPITP